MDARVLIPIWLPSAIGGGSITQVKHSNEDDLLTLSSTPLRRISDQYPVLWMTAIPASGRARFLNLFPPLKKKPLAYDRASCQTAAGGRIFRSESLAPRASRAYANIKTTSQTGYRRCGLLIFLLQSWQSNRSSLPCSPFG